MADRYQDRPFPADDDYDRGDDPHASAKGESDPLAELARLIGQTDPFGSMGRANQPVQPRGARARSVSTPPAAEPEDEPARRARRHGCSAPPGRKPAAPDRAAEQDYPERGASAASLRGRRMPRPSRIIMQAPPFADDADQRARSVAL